jgi:hypothetical protein
MHWLTEGGPSPLTGQMAEKPVPVRPVARELAVAEGQTYGRNRQQSQYAQGVLHALMWAQYATAAPRRVSNRRPKRHGVHIEDHAPV